MKTLALAAAVALTTIGASACSDTVTRRTTYQQTSSTTPGA